MFRFCMNFYASDVCKCFDLSVETSLLACPWPLTALCTLAFFTSARATQRKYQVRDLPHSKASDGFSNNIGLFVFPTLITSSQAGHKPTAKV